MEKREAVLRAIDSLSENTGKIVSWFMVLCVLFILYEVIMRYFFNDPTRWVFETTLMLWGAYFVMVTAWTHKVGGHVAVDIIYNRFPLRVRLTLDLVFCLVLCLPWIGALVIGGIDVAANAWKIKECTASPWGPPVYPIKTVLPIAFTLLGLQCLTKFVRDLVTLIRGKV